MISPEKTEELMILADKYALHGLKVYHFVGGEVMHIYMSIRASESASAVLSVSKQPCSIFEAV